MGVRVAAARQERVAVSQRVAVDTGVAAARQERLAMSLVVAAARQERLAIGVGVAAARQERLAMSVGLAAARQERLAMGCSLAVAVRVGLGAVIDDEACHSWLGASFGWKPVLAWSSKVLLGRDALTRLMDLGFALGVDLSVEVQASWSSTSLNALTHDDGRQSSK